MRLFWQGSPSTSLTPLIESYQWEKLRHMLLPEGLSRTGLLEETAVNTYLQKAAQTEASMLTRVAELSKNYQYEISDSFIKILKLRAASPN
jgi:hypothetical protein